MIYIFSIFFFIWNYLITCDMTNHRDRIKELERKLKKLAPESRLDKGTGV